MADRKTAEQFKADIEKDIAEIDGKKPAAPKQAPRRTVPCEGCAGTGLQDHLHKCPDCDATGRVPAPAPKPVTPKAQG